MSKFGLSEGAVKVLKNWVENEVYNATNHYYDSKVDDDLNVSVTLRDEYKEKAERYPEIKVALEQYETRKGNAIGYDVQLVFPTLRCNNDYFLDGGYYDDIHCYVSRWEDIASSIQILTREEFFVSELEEEALAALEEEAEKQAV